LGLDLIRDGIIKKKPVYADGKYSGVFCLESATGNVYVSRNSPQFISGHIRMRGKDHGRYPFGYKEMLEELFGIVSSSEEQIEVCSGWVDKQDNLVTVDINPERNPTWVGDGQNLPKEWENRFARWSSDPPYNEKTAEKMYGTQLPSWSKLLTEGAKVTQPRGLLFLLLGGEKLDNLQWHPKGTTRIGWFALSIIPNQEARAIHIYLKNDDPLTGSSVQKEITYHIQTLNTFF
jgi:hypothetical protein